jgi:D-alanyl-lipoteichoic acid acyltransferase DltB (MBOAT superfamily)
MIFNSTKFILIFLPSVFFVYFTLNRLRFITAGKAWLVVASLIFYGYWSVAFIPLLLLSITVNYLIGHRLESHQRPSKTILVVGISLNLILLAYFKYTNFFIDNINTLTSTNLFIEQIALPLGISFYTFTQIAFLVDCYRKTG